MSTLVGRTTENQCEHRGNSMGDWSDRAWIYGANTDTIGVYRIARESLRLLHRVVCGRYPDCISLDLLLRSEFLACHTQYVYFSEHSYRDAAYRAFAAG